MEPVYKRPPRADSLSNSALEQMLKEARLDVRLRAKLHQQLLESEVLVPVEAQPDDLRRGTIPAGSDLNVITLTRSDGAGVIPFFTSAERLYRWSPAGEQCVLITVKELFESRPDMHFYLNLRSPDGQEFSPSKVREVLARSGVG